MAGTSPTPSELGKALSNPDAAQRRASRDMERVRAEGVAEGRQQARAEFLSYLEKRYMAPDIVRGEPKADAILTLTKEMAEFFRNWASTPKGRH